MLLLDYGVKKTVPFMAFEIRNLEKIPEVKQTRSPFQIEYESSYRIKLNSEVQFNRVIYSVDRVPNPTELF